MSLELLPVCGWPTFPSVLWCCWLGLLTCKSVSQITYTVLVETLNPAQSNLTMLLKWLYYVQQQTGKQKVVRLLPMAMLENDKIESIKLEEHRGCSLICTGIVGQGSSVSLCIACKRTIYVYELNRTKQRYRRMKEVMCPGVVPYIGICNERLCVGYPSSFAIYSIQGEGAPVGKL